jgi:hypothetical protein
MPRPHEIVTAPELIEVAGNSDDERVVAGEERISNKARRAGAGERSASGEGLLESGSTGDSRSGHCGKAEASDGEKREDGRPAGHSR